jgi:hypothetical protein
MKLWKKSLLGALALVGVYFFCEWQTQGFRYHHLLSDFSEDPRWKVFVTPEELERASILLDQPFTYLGKGGFCRAFLGQDGQTVLKFYHHDRFRLSDAFQPFSWHKLLLKTPLQLILASEYHAFAFKSCRLLYERVRGRTGLLFIHLNKTCDLKKQVALIDPSGVIHTIDPNQTEFVLQQRGELLLDYIARVMKKRDADAAKRAIDSYLACLVQLSQCGVQDLDHSFRGNFGILEDGTVITIDISSYVDNARIATPACYKREIVLKSHRLAKWLKKHYPDIYAYYDEKITQLMDEDLCSAHCLRSAFDSS